MRNDIKNLLDAVVYSEMAKEIEFYVKCETRDGRIEIFEHNKYDKNEGESLEEYTNRVNSDLTECLMDYLEQVENEEFSVFLDSMLCVRNSEITRIWVEIGDIYII